MSDNGRKAEIEAEERNNIAELNERRAELLNKSTGYSPALRPSDAYIHESLGPQLTNEQQEALIQERVERRLGFENAVQARQEEIKQQRNAPQPISYEDKEAQRQALREHLQQQFENSRQNGRGR